MARFNAAFEPDSEVKSDYFGKGKVESVSNRNVTYPITVLFEDGNVVKFTKEGKYQDDPFFNNDPRKNIIQIWT